MNLIASALTALALAAAPAPPPITWPEFFAHVGNEGLEYSDALRSLEGKRVRLRGYAIRSPAVPGGLLLGRDPAGELHDVDEVEVPYDAVGVVWRKGIRVPTVPARPTVEGTLRLGNHTVGNQAVAILIEDAVPIYPARPQQNPR